MTKRLPIYLLSAALLSAVAPGCNSDKEDINTVSYSNVAVDGFSLSRNDSVLANLDSVFFSIDLDKALIYNADSLPVGTDVSKLVVKITTQSVGAVELHVPRVGASDSVINYLENQYDSIDFSHGPVTLRITSQDRLLTRDYKINVNVHRMQPDSLSWDQTERRDLPTSLSAPTAARAVEYKGEYIIMTGDATGAACVATADNPSGEWTLAGAALPAGADIESLAAGAEELFITTADGNLYRASEPEGPWTATGATMHTVFGAYGDTAIGARRYDDGRWTLLTWPTTTEEEAPADFPVTEVSQLLVYTTAWSDRPTAIMAGGRTASGAMTGKTWAWDGTKWACINNNGKNEIAPREGLTLIPYFAYRTSRIWRVTRQSVILAIGGQLGMGIPARTVYLSWDRGITWLPAPEPMRLPEYVTIGTRMSALVADSELSRASRPVTEWECPYIYLVGGHNGAGTLLTDVWRGVINRMTFAPLY